MTAVKICGITRPADAEAAARLGARAIGLIFYAKSARNITADVANEIVSALPPFITAVGLFVNPTSRQVEDVLRDVKLGILQFHGEETPAFCGRFAMPYLKAARVNAGLDLVQ